MSSLKILFVEDDETQERIFLATAKDLMKELGITIEIKCCGSITFALEALQKSDFDGAVIDLKLGKDEDGGSQVIEHIGDSFKRIPFIVVTGTPSHFEPQNTSCLGPVRRKGEKDAKYEDVIKELYGLYRTGLTKIIGGRGEIEKYLNKIFIEHLLLQKDKWVMYGEKSSKNTEKALMRHTLNHLIQHLDNEIQEFYPEEFYIYPPVNDRYNTGSIIKNKKSEDRFVIMSPACDLAERSGGSCNTDRALLVRVSTQAEVLEEKLLEKRGKKPTLEKLNSSDEKSALENLRDNKKSYYHWLPNTKFFNGGFLNFRTLVTYTKDELLSEFDKPSVQISSPFIKDIIARFSSYYARQGQPDIKNIDD